MVDYGIVLGLLGVASGAASLIYSRSQVVAARRQAEQATRATLLESNREISVRLQQIRSRFFKVHGIDDELKNSRPEIQEVVDSVGGGDVYGFFRDVIDTFEDIFVLRRSRIVTDEHWRVWTGSQMAVYAGLPRFQSVFKLAKQEGFLDPEFVRFFELSSTVGPSETQGSLLEIPAQRGCLVSGEPDRNRKERPASTMFLSHVRPVWE